MAQQWRPDDGWELFLATVGVGAAIYWVWTSLASSELIVVVVVAVSMLTAVLFRRRYPLVAAASAVAASVLPPIVHSNAVAPWTVAQLVLFSLSLRLRMRWSAACAGALAVLLLVTSLIFYEAGSPALPLGVIAWTFGVWGLASSIASQRALVSTLADRAAELVREREREIRQRLVAQRMQIARDLHDELAHNVAVISLNAGAAEAGLPKDAVASREALRTVRFTARAVISELQEILGLLRAEDGRDGRLRRFEEVLSGARELGLEVNSSGQWLSSAEPPASHVAASRILQESLTNARRHGSARTATVEFTQSAREWTLTVNNPVARDAVNAGFGSAQLIARPGGFGLIGMTERAELIGGSFTSERVGPLWVARLIVPRRTPTPENLSDGTL